MTGAHDTPEYVTLVDVQDRPIGRVEKLRAHREGLLHRACSVVVFDGSGAMLLQRRHPGKYHSGGLWSNTCCTHPRPGESAASAAKRRLYEEMGMRAVVLRPAFTFVYRAAVSPDLVEHEYDHVFTGCSDEVPDPHGEEVIDWRWSFPKEIQEELAQNPSRYSCWFPPLFERLRANGFSCIS